MKDDKIDIVYLWVDGSDKKWRESRNYWYDKINNKTVETANNLSDSLYRDNGELKYSLRSVAENVPWVNHIYIITGFNQIPKWLDTTNPKITIVPHEQIMPKAAIPTFNSSSIEMCIPNIKNLSEKFILINDDMLFNKKIKPSFFFDRRGRAIVRYNKHKDFQRDTKKWFDSVDRYTHTLILSALKIKEIFGKTYLKYRPSHGIDPYIKSSMIECRNHPLVKKQIDKQILEKFRIRNGLQRWLFNLYSVMTDKSVLVKARGYKSGRHWFSNFIYNTIFWHATRKSPVFCFDAKQQKNAIKHAPVFCINDSKYTTDETIKNNIDFLEHRFPNPSPFEKEHQDKIDIVYLWVDGSDKKWRAEKDKWLQKITGRVPMARDSVATERFRDNCELMYSMRSVAECAPWINHIYIVTGFDQVPKWLNTKHKKITIVPHEQIMPKSAIPTFNSNSIEMCIPNIKNLSEKFLLMNDDMFFNKKLKPSFFFDKHGRTKFNYSKNSYNSKIPFDKWKETLDGYTQTLALSAKYIDDMFGIKMYNMRPSHGIDPYLKSSWIECRNTKQLKNQIDNQINNKFRTNNEIQRWTMNMYDFAMGRSVFHHSRAIKYGKKHRLSNWLYNIIHIFSIKNSNVVFTNAVKAKDAIKKAATFCMNDSQDNNEEILKSNREFLEQRFPNKSEFEK